MTSITALRLRQARQKAGISQEKLGIKAGIDEFSASARMNQYETGKRTPSYLTIKRIAKALGYPTEFFYCEDDPTAEMICLLYAIPSSKKPSLFKAIKKLIEL